MPRVEKDTWGGELRSTREASGRIDGGPPPCQRVFRRIRSREQIADDVARARVRELERPHRILHYPQENVESSLTVDRVPQCRNGRTQLVIGSFGRSS
jgi:hypothetical protein